MAWTDKAKTPKGLPLGQAQISAMAFSYLRDKARGYEKALWNCGQFKRASKGECMKLQVLGTPAGELAAARTRSRSPRTDDDRRDTARRQLLARSPQRPTA